MIQILTIIDPKLIVENLYRHTKWDSTSTLKTCYRILSLETDLTYAFEHKIGKSVSCF